MVTTFSRLDIYRVGLSILLVGQLEGENAIFSLVRLNGR